MSRWIEKLLKSEIWGYIFNIYEQLNFIFHLADPKRTGIGGGGDKNTC